MNTSRPIIRRCILATLCIVTGGCGGSTGSTTSHPERASSSESPNPSAAEHTTGTAPAHARLLGPDAPVPGQIELTLELERHVPLEYRLEISLRLPEGTTLAEPMVAGSLDAGEPGASTASRYSFAPNQAPRVDQLRILLECDSIPSDDVVVVVHGASAAAGFHAEPRYRFGRSEPEAAQPALGEPLRVGGRELGRPVEMPPAP